MFNTILQWLDMPECIRRLELDVSELQDEVHRLDCDKADERDVDCKADESDVHDLEYRVDALEGA